MHAPPKGASAYTAAPVRVYDDHSFGGPPMMRCGSHPHVDRFRRAALAAALALAALAGADAADGPPSPGWPQWRGPGRDGVALAVKLPATWPANLSRAWSVPVG